MGAPASIATEYNENGIHLVRANNDRAAGYMRLLELLHVDPLRVPPSWARVRDGVEGAPRLFVSRHCKQLIAQLKSAPIAVDGADAGECVDPQWESAHGHAVASARYGAMSRPSPSPRPVEEPEDWAGFRMSELLRRYESREDVPFDRSRYIW